MKPTKSSDSLLQHYDLAQWKHKDRVRQVRNGQVLVEEIEDCEPIIEAAKVLSEREPGKDFRHAAFIPRHVMNRAIREGWHKDPKAWKRWANDPDNSAFRSWPGKL